MEDNLLQQIQSEAVDSAKDISSLLRKCRILAQRIENDDLKKWVSHELDGYEDGESVPDYRVVRSALILGDYFGSFGGGVKNMPIPISQQEQPLRDMLCELSYTQGIREIEELVNDSDGPSLRYPVPPEAHGFIKNNQVREDLILASATRFVNKSSMMGIIDAVRNRILNFTLEIGTEAKRAGKRVEDLNEKDAAKVQQIFNTEIKGNVGNLAQNSTHVKQKTNLVVGDKSKLVEELKNVGVSEELVEEIIDAVAVEEPNPNGGLGAKVSQLLGKVFEQGALGLLNVPGDVAGNLITAAILAYYGR